MRFVLVHLLRTTLVVATSTVVGCDAPTPDVPGIHLDDAGAPRDSDSASRDGGRSDETSSPRVDASTGAPRVDASIGSVDAGSNGSNGATYVTPGSPTLTVRYGITQVLHGIFDPETPPPGANDWSCRSAIHPRPVILVHGTLMNQRNAWESLAPLLWNEGYCVYTFNYGGPPILGTVYGTHDVAESAEELAAFVDLVLARTGATEVDLVGHSQGGLMPRYYVRYLGGAAKVHHLVGVAPSNQGTTLFGFISLIRVLGLGGIVGDVLDATVCAACTDQMVGSDFLAAVNLDGGTVPGVTYTVLATRYDEIATPHSSQFLAGEGATNLLLQDVCALDLSGHIGIVVSPVALRLVLNALDPSRAVAPRCVPIPFAG